MYLSHGAYFQVIISFSKPRTRLKYVKIITGERGLFLFGRSMCSPIFYVCVCVRARVLTKPTNRSPITMAEMLRHIADGLVRHFGSLVTSMNTLFRAISGGVTWEAPAEFLHYVGPEWTCVFTFYVAFCCPLAAGLFLLFFCAARCVVGATTLRCSDGKG